MLLAIDMRYDSNVIWISSMGDGFEHCLYAVAHISGDCVRQHPLILGTVKAYPKLGCLVQACVIYLRRDLSSGFSMSSLLDAAPHMSSPFFPIHFQLIQTSSSPGWTKCWSRGYFTTQNGVAACLEKVIYSSSQVQLYRIQRTVILSKL